MTVLVTGAAEMIEAVFFHWFLFSLSSPYPGSWLGSPKFILGVSLFLGGFVINIHSDSILFSNWRFII